MVELKHKKFTNGSVFVLETTGKYLIEVTDTFLPYYTKDAIGRNQNFLSSLETGSRFDRWMIGVSCMSGCPVRCKFCATGKLKKFRNLTMEEIIEQIKFVLQYNSKYEFSSAREHKINYTRMGDPFLNIDAVKCAIKKIDKIYKETHHYISTIGVKDSDFSWIKDNITLQISLHSLDENRRDELIPYKNKMTIKELGQIRTKSSLKTTLNLTLVDYNDFNIEKLKEYFDPKYFFIKLSPINRNEVSDINGLGAGVVEGINLV